MSSTSQPVTSLSRLRAAYRLSRPDQVLLIFVVYAVGCAANAHHRSGGPPAPGDALLVGLVLALVSVSVHAANEHADVETDALTVRTRFSGGSGALVDHDLPPAFALRIAQAAGGAAIAVLGVGWAAGRVSTTVGAALVPFLPFTLLVFVNLLETQGADRVADQAVGKHTLASRMSPHALRLLGGAAAAAAYVLAFLLQPQRVALAGLLAARFRRTACGGSAARSARALGRGDGRLLLVQGAAWLT